MNRIKFPPNSILNHQNENTSPKEIFQEVCDLIGNYYQQFGFKYTRSRPKITIKDSDFDIVIAFWSSSSNMAGRYINLEIIGHAYSKKLAQIDKIEGNTYKGFVLSHADFWTKLNTSNPNGCINTYLLDGQLAVKQTKDIPYAIDRFNCNYNLYCITENQIDKIINYIDKYFVNQIIGLVNKENMKKFLEELPFGKQLGIDNNRFCKFIELQFNNDGDLIELIKIKQIMR